MSSPANTNIEHDPRRQRFYASTVAGEAHLDYEQVDRDTLDFRSTFVPPDARGRGIAGEIVEHALEWARDRQLDVVPSCSFVADWIRDHPEYRAVTVPREDREAS